MLKTSLTLFRWTLIEHKYYQILLFPVIVTSIALIRATKLIWTRRAIFRRQMEFSIEGRDSEKHEYNEFQFQVSMIRNDQNEMLLFFYLEEKFVTSYRS